MPIYISLMNFTDQGIKDIKNSAQRLQEATKRMEATGGKMLGFYVTMGQYDCVAITEGPSDEAAMAQLVTLGALGNVRTTTLKGFTPQEFAEILKKLP